MGPLEVPEGLSALLRPRLWRARAQRSAENGEGRCNGMIFRLIHTISCGTNDPMMPSTRPSINGWHTCKVNCTQPPLAVAVRKGWCVYMSKFQDTAQWPRERPEQNMLNMCREQSNVHCATTGGAVHECEDKRLYRAVIWTSKCTISRMGSTYNEYERDTDKQIKTEI